MSEAFGRYELLKRVGGGGAGEVFLARELGATTLDRLVVVKTLLPERADSREFLSMFLDEAKLASQLDHPNVCKVLDLGLVDGTLFMALEFVHGIDLEQLARQLAEAGQQLSVALAVRIVSDAAAGLQHAHLLAGADGRRLGLIHRDLSPHNLLVSFHGDVKIIDFGFAKADGRLTETQSGVIKGKFAYMSPEQVRAERLDQRSDLFSLGIVFWELLTGQRLFRRLTDMETVAAIVSGEWPLPSTINPRVPRSLDALVRRLLERDRNQRFPDAQSVRVALEEWLREERRTATRDALASFVRSLCRAQLERENAQGLLHDAPQGRVSRLRGRSGTSGGAVPWETIDDEPSDRTHVNIRVEQSVTVATARPYTSVVRTLQKTQKLHLDSLAEQESESAVARALKRAMSWASWSRN